MVALPGLISQIVASTVVANPTDPYLVEGSSDQVAGTEARGGESFGSAWRECLGFEGQSLSADKRVAKIEERVWTLDMWLRAFES